LKISKAKCGIAVVSIAAVAGLVLATVLAVNAGGFRTRLLGFLDRHAPVTEFLAEVLGERLCEFDKAELEFASPPAVPFPSPSNETVQQVLAGKSPEALHRGHVGHDPQFIVAYPERLSVSDEEAVVFRYARGLFGTGTHLAAMTVVNAETHDVVWRRALPKDEAALELEPCRSFHNGGCAFSRSVTVPPDGLTIGSYYLFLTDDTGARSYPVFFVVRPRPEDMPQFDIVIVYPEFTWHAYNQFGGGSLYNLFRRTGDGRIEPYEHSVTRLYAVNLDRPVLFDPTGRMDGWSREGARAYFESTKGTFPTRLDLRQVRVSTREYEIYRHWETGPHSEQQGWMQILEESPEATLPLLRSLKRAGHRVAAVTSHDLHARADLLKHAKIVVLSGHAEYWTADMGRRIADHILRGGHVANFAGNVFWGQVNLRDRNLYLDQLGGRRNAACRTLVSERYLGTGFLGVNVQPGTEALLGVSYRFAGYPIKEYYYLRKKGYAAHGVTESDLTRATGVTVRAPDHPAFAGTGLGEGARWGRDVPLLSVEIDGAPRTPDGLLDRDAAPDLPRDVRVLATALAFAGNNVTTKSGRTYYGKVEPAVFVELRPFDTPKAGTVMSFGTIGYSIAVAAGDRPSEQVFLNTIRYLLAK
jgi:hypothetical protein